MAYIENTVLDDEKKRKLQAVNSDQQVNSELSTSGGFSAPSASAAGGTNNSQTQTQDNPGSTFNRIRELNQDQALQLANNLSSNAFNTNKTNLSNSANKIQTNFNTEVDKNTTALNDDSRGFLDASFKSPKLDQSGIARFNDIKDAYQGPDDYSSNDLAEFNTVNSTARQNINSLDTDEGRRNSLLDLYKANANGRLPSTGTIGFDQQLLNQEGVQPIFKDTVNRFNTEADTISNNFTKNSQDKVKAAKEASDIAKKYLDDSFSSTQKAFQDRINSDVATEQARINSRNQQIENFLNSLTGQKAVFDQQIGQSKGDEFDAGTLQLLGINPQQAADLKNAQTRGTVINPKEFLTLNDPKLNKNSIVSDQDRDYYNDLVNLYGTNDDFLGADETQGGNVDFDYNRALQNASIDNFANLYGEENETSFSPNRPNDFLNKYSFGVSKSIFGKKNSAGTDNYKSYKGFGANDFIGRNFADDNQFGGTQFNVYKENRKGDVLKGLGEVFGTGNGLNDKKTNAAFQEKINNFITSEIQGLLESGKLPRDYATLQTIDGQKIFNQLIAPKLNALIQQKTGKGDTIKAEAGVVENFLADLTDRLFFNNFANPTRNK